MSRIFISYRCADTEDISGRIHDAMVNKYGVANIFKDVYSIPLGKDFRKVLREAVSQCELMLVIIGRQWISVVDEDGERRLDNPNDWVRFEVEAALERDIPVIPALVQGVVMPKERDLPSSLADLAYRNSFTVRGDPYFRGDVAMLIERMAELLQSAAPKRAATSAKSREGPRSQTKPPTVTRPTRPVAGTKAPRDVEGATALLKNGEALLDEERYVEALAAFRGASRRNPFSVMRGLLT